ncbi:VOC family protein [Tepidiforma sp.]|uniref:VOC family protein n=1 Tax=Tepidiforma sp. TaxID=2682230 RepID=UPI002ADDC182|nr:VOC family protein [Tepidiforma sp.]
MARVRRLNHAVLFVRDARRAAAFYEQAFGFEVIADMDGRAVFLRAAGSENHHDLGLFSLGPAARGPFTGQQVGLYHLAWEVETIEDLAAMRQVLAELGALTGQSDHGATKSLYGRDPDGNEFEVMWMVPREEWGPYDRDAVTRPLDLERELARFGGRG